MTAIAEFRVVRSLASSASVYRAGRRARMFMHYPVWFPDCRDVPVRFIRFWPAAGLAQLVSCSINRFMGK